MPVISRFYGIIIRMYFRASEHNPPHIHAIYGEDVAAVEILTGEVIEGYLPPTAIDMVRKWTDKNKQKLLKMWNTQEIKKLPPLV